MSLFDKIFGSTSKDSENSNVSWNSLVHINEIENLVEESYKMPIAVFKHSTRCGISRMVLNSFEKQYGLKKEDAQLYFLDLLRFRDISDALANRFHIRHESPQLLVIKEGQIVHHASHGSINASAIEAFI
ncbi:bacillithiol system redox-active protein YtxJ [Zhouia amylolytica]|uniref:bacillithiol system redox-active protein YtxJ n=1 Tax=Zhouia amylolytica TaxID=376730 RepID=UPI0020CD788E|nr:bacillithiol system redox-active protein YtxJ [Zhouia amylolytica]MCQ0110813.1 bacillithiol system redox-active protein YtxJ [Zhouia amylolytica]